jgi:hypothetical protein
MALAQLVSADGSAIFHELMDIQKNRKLIVNIYFQTMRTEDGLQLFNNEIIILERHYLCKDFHIARISKSQSKLRNSVFVYAV